MITSLPARARSGSNTARPLAATRLRVVIFTSMAPQAVMRLSSRIRSEVAEAFVAGIVYELPRHKALGTRCRDFLRNLRRPAFVKYVARRLWGATGRVVSGIGDAILQFVHADTRSSAGRQTDSSLPGLKRYCAAHDVPLHVTNDLHDEASLEFTRALDPALGLVFGTRILKPQLFEIPRLGSINIHKRKVPEYKGGGPIGLWELLDRQHELGITVHRVAKEVDAGAIVAEASLPIQQFDTLTSLALKADVVGDDLLVQTVAAFAHGSVADRPQSGPGRTFRKPGPEELIAYERRIAAARPFYQPRRGRPLWKLLLRGTALVPWLVARNWWRRIRGGFPVIILCHHLVTDRA
ncbi:MAG TPA: formyltransferase family protein, partial [Planctomycetaceae bacterium]